MQDIYSIMKCALVTILIRSLIDNIYEYKNKSYERNSTKNR